VGVPHIVQKDSSARSHQCEYIVECAEPFFFMAKVMQHKVELAIVLPLELVPGKRIV
jgi:hypothetical protein